MDPAQLANEACKRFAALHSAPSTAQLSAAQTSVETQNASVDTRTAVTAAPAAGGPGSEPLLEAFKDLAVLDGWAKISMARLAADPQDARAHQELRRSLEQVARLHPQFTRRLADVLADRPAVKTNLSSTGALPLQQLGGR